LLLLWGGVPISIGWTAWRSHGRRHLYLGYGMTAVGAAGLIFTARASTLRYWGWRQSMSSALHEKPNPHNHEKSKSGHGGQFRIRAHSD
jgi:hypothetical protein